MLLLIKFFVFCFLMFCCFAFLGHFLKGCFVFLLVFLSLLYPFVFFFFSKISCLVFLKVVLVKYMISLKGMFLVAYDLLTFLEGLLLLFVF